MNKKIKYVISGLIIAILILMIMNFQSPLLQGGEIIKPPPALLKIDGKEQTSGIGSYCWSGFYSSVCADAAGITTPEVPLPAKSPVSTAHLSLPISEPPLGLELNIIQVTDKDALELKVEGSRLWGFREGKYIALPPESEQDINLSLEPGFYVLEVSTRWKEKGSVSYGFLLKCSKGE